MIRLIIAVISMISTGIIFAEESYWDRFRGPNGQGIMEGSKPPADLNIEKNLTWKIPLPLGHSSPVIWGDKIFLTADEGDKLSTIGINRNTGKVIWKNYVQKVNVKSEKRLASLHAESSNAASTFCADNDFVYIYFPKYGVVCYNHEGEKQWETLFPPQPFMNGAGTSAIIHENTVYILRDSFTDNNSFLYALNKNNGKELWKIPRHFSKATYSTPTIMSTLHGNLLIAFGSGRFIGYDLSTGKEKIFLDSIGGLPISVPLAQNGIVYISAKEGRGGDVEYDFDRAWDYIMTFDQDQNGKVETSEITEEFKIPLRTGLPFDHPDFGRTGRANRFKQNDTNKDNEISFEEFKMSMQNSVNKSKAAIYARIDIKNNIGNLEENIVWKHNRLISEVPSILLYRDHLYSIDHGGIFIVRNTEDGEVLKRARLQNARGMYASSPVAANGHIYFCSQQGVISVMKADSSFEILHQLDLNELIYATPAIQDNSIYIRTNQHLYAFNNEN